jgi:DNA polymerase-3 subunit alpha
VLESLIKAGAFDSLGRPRAALLQEIDAAMAAGQRLARSRDRSQTGLFDLGEPSAVPSGTAVKVEEFSRTELLAMERDMLGMYVSGHPLTHVRDRLALRTTATADRLPELRDRSEVVVGGLITALKRTTTRNGAAMAFLTLEDLTGVVEVIVFPKVYEQCHLALRRDAVVVVRGRLDISEQQVKVLADGVVALEEAPEGEGPAAGAETAEPPDGEGSAGVAETEEPQHTAGEEVLHVIVDAGRYGEDGLRRLREILDRHPGDRPVLLTVRAEGREVRMQAGDLKVARGPAVVEQVERLLGPHTVEWVADGHD